VRILRRVEATELFDLEASPVANAVPAIDWTTVKPDLSRGEGRLPRDRTERKRDQILNVSASVDRLAPRGATVVDFCCGLGHQSALLAEMRPDLRLILVDRDQATLDLARKRTNASSKNNVSFVRSAVADFDGPPFDVGLALHACGSASDDVIDKCLQYDASFVVCPCCLGKVATEGRQRKKALPRSRKLRQIVDSEDSFRFLVRAADTHHYNGDATRRKCKTLLALDRLTAAEETAPHYHTSLVRMTPPTATPKNDILIGRSNRQGERTNT